MRLRSRALMIAISGLFISSAASAAVPIHLWSKDFGGSSNEVAYGVAIDAAGAVIITGHYQVGTDFGGGPLPFVGNQDLFVAKFDASGAHLWSKGFGGTFLDRGWAICVDAADNVIVTGQYSGTIDFGGGPLASNAGSDDIFLVKYAPNGAHIWSKRFGGTASQADIGYGVTTDASGNVLLTGVFVTSVDFGGGPLAGAGSGDIFIATFDPSGAHIWSKGLGGTGNDRCNSIGLDAAGNVSITGSFSNTVDFGGGPLVSAGGGDVFVANFDAAGNHQWSKRAGSTLSDAGEFVAADGSGRVAVVGIFTNSADFGGGPLAGAGGNDAFVAQYDAGGAHQWSQSFASAGSDIVRAVAIDPGDNLVITGYFGGTINFGGGPLTPIGSTDVFIASYDAGGAYRWSQSFGSTGFDDPHADAVDNTGHVVIAGGNPAPINFGGGTLPHGGHDDAFVAKFLDESPVPVLFSRFTATPHGADAIVQWDLQSDEGLNAFTLYRSESGAPEVAVATGDARTTRSVTDTGVEAGKTYRYELMISSLEGDQFRSPAATLTMPALANVLLHNEPNPFKAWTTISFNLGTEGKTRLEVFDVSGRRVALLLDGVKRAGGHRVDFDAASLPSGIYLYRLTSGHVVEQKKMLLVK